MNYLAEAEKAEQEARVHWGEYQKHKQFIYLARYNSCVTKANHYRQLAEENGQ